ncbi:MAG TPA: hypothetical protein VGE98_04975, partial [Thermoanaerobaculia bacterium]
RLVYRDGQELWGTDGTVAGTADLGGSVTATLVAQGGRVYFVSADPGSQTFTLGSTDGTLGGTRQVVGLGALQSADVLATAGGKVYVFAERSSVAPVLIATDGTAAGTKRISRVALAPYNRVPPVDVGGRLFFSGSTRLFAPSGSLWVSDGTAQGTKPVVDASGHAFDNPTALRAFAGTLVFATADATATRLWQSDGTPAGTRLLLTFLNPTSTTGTDLTVVGDRLFFSRTTKASGTELWALRP